MDLFSQDALTKFSTKKMVQIIPDLVENITTSYFNLGGMILRIRNEGLFAAWGDEEYTAFEDWCDAVLKFGLRKAQYLAAIHQGVFDINPSTELRDRLLRLGWVKVGQILRVADSKKSLAEWVETAESLTLRDLQNKIRWELGKGKGDDEVEQDDQELETTITRRFTLTEGQNEHFDQAIALIAKRFPTATVGEQLDMLATNYMAMNVRDDEGGIAVELANIIENLQACYGVNLHISKPSADSAPKKMKKKKVG